MAVRPFSIQKFDDHNRFGENRFKVQCERVPVLGAKELPANGFFAHLFRFASNKFKQGWFTRNFLVKKFFTAKCFSGSVLATNLFAVNYRPNAWMILRKVISKPRWFSIYFSNSKLNCTITGADTSPLLLSVLA